jgi:hypothetical protein
MRESSYLISDNSRGYFRLVEILDSGCHYSSVSSGRGDMLRSGRGSGSGREIGSARFPLRRIVSHSEINQTNHLFSYD